MRVTVAGAGCVGVASAAAFAAWGHDTTCADIDRERIRSLSRGVLPFHEPGLQVLVAQGVEAGRLRFADELRSALSDADVVVVAVGDAVAVDAVADAVSTTARRRTVLAIKSTVPLGTCRALGARLAGGVTPIDVVSFPEFLREGSAVEDVLRPDRVVVGVGRDAAPARAAIEELCGPVRERIVWMDPTSAELTKYAANAMLAARISFVNEIAALCERVGADVRSVREGIAADHRIGPHMLHAGAGYGGSCLPKDVAALVEEGRRHGVELSIAAATHAVNVRQRDLLSRRLASWFDGDLNRRRIAIWGLAFKPGTDDLREAPAVHLIERLLAEGAEVRAHDPQASAAIERRFGDRVIVARDPLAAVEGADALVLVTEWPEYTAPDFDALARKMRRKLILDLRNLWVGRDLRARGFSYEGIGVPA